MMTYFHLDQTMQNLVPGNVVRTVGTKWPITLKQIGVIRVFLGCEKRLRSRALFNQAKDSDPRGCDLMKLKIGELVAGSEVRNRLLLIQRKTCQPV